MGSSNGENLLPVPAANYFLNNHFVSPILYNIFAATFLKFFIIITLPDSIMVVRQILDLYVEVRALVGQPDQVKSL